MLIIVLLSLCLRTTTFGDVITLKKGTNVTCVLTEEDTDSAVYLRPYSTKKVIPQTLSRLEWLTNDWSQKDSSKIEFKAITDSRWNELPEFRVQSYKPTRKKFDITLSVCSVHTILTINIEIRQNLHARWTKTKFNVKVPRITSEHCTWVHFILCNVKGSIALIREYIDIRQSLSADSWLRFNQFPNSTAKRHLYNFLWSESTSYEPSTLNVKLSRSERVCVHFYVSIDRGCHLYVVMKAGGKFLSFKIINGFNKPGKLKEWKYIKIEENLAGVNVSGAIMEFYRRKTRGVPGFWAIDHIRYCHNNSTIFTASLHASQVDQTTCQTMKEHVRTIQRSILTNRTKVGCLTENCKVHCEDILGPSYKYCEEHQICKDNYCSCAWGYKGAWCKEKCSNATWGMNCLNHCEENCNQCNPMDGTCDETFKASTSSKKVSSVSSTISSQYIFSNTSSITSRTSFTTPKSTSTSLEIPNEVPENKLPTPKLPPGKPPPENSSFHPEIFLFLLLLVLSLLLLSFLFRRYLDSKQMANQIPLIDPLDVGRSKVSVTDFDHYIRRSLTNGCLVNQFNNLINDPSESQNVALEPTNMIKNYDRINVPYDYNRVILEPMELVGSSDYINASYIDGWGRSKAYILTQGPKSVTIPDFWRMVWQHNVKTIVMATNFRENLKRECVEYFPLYLNASILHAEIGIKLVKEEFYEFYEKRILEIYYEREHKMVTHYFLNWKPELGRPLYPNDLVPLVQIMNENYKDEEDLNPIVVHCNFGVGRSAILVLSDIALQMAKRGGYVDVYDVAKMLREQRPNIITSSKDYILAHLVVSECLKAQNEVFQQSNSISISVQLELLNTFTYHDGIVNSLSGCNHSMPVPYVEYLNHFGSKLKYCYANQPAQNNSVACFWMAVLRQKMKTIVFLNEHKVKLWPFRHQMSRRKLCTVVHVGSSHNSYCITSKILIKEEDTRTTTLYEAEIVFLQLLRWKSKRRGKNLNVENLLQLLEDVRNLDPAPERILVCCLDGISDCGLFIAMSFIIRKYLSEVQYDIPNAVRMLRRSNLAFLSKPIEIRILHEMITLYSQRFDPYKTIDSE